MHNKRIETDWFFTEKRVGDNGVTGNPLCRDGVDAYLISFTSIS